MYREIYSGKSRKRDRLEILFQILYQALDLEESGEEVTKTRIFYGVEIGFYTGNRYLRLLLKNGLLEKTKGKEKYQVTEKGKEFVKSYEKLREIFPFL